MANFLPTSVPPAANEPVIHRGRVRWYDSKKGYGFIQPLNRQFADAFIHMNDLKCNYMRLHEVPLLFTGEYVEYKLEIVEGGKQKAYWCTGIAGGPLLCESGKLIFQSYNHNVMDAKKLDEEEAPAPL